MVNDEVTVKALGAKLRGLTVRERVLAALYQIRPKNVRAHDSVRALLREQALAKLSPAEREALGLPAGDPPAAADAAGPGRPMGVSGTGRE